MLSTQRIRKMEVPSLTDNRISDGSEEGGKRETTRRHRSGVDDEDLPSRDH